MSKTEKQLDAEPLSEPQKAEARRLANSAKESRRGGVTFIVICPLCGRDSVNSRALYRHISRWHRDKLNT